jgi:hypothetical protein
VLTEMVSSTSRRCWDWSGILSRMMMRPRRGTFRRGGTLGAFPGLSRCRGWTCSSRMDSSMDLYVYASLHNCGTDEADYRTTRTTSDTSPTGIHQVLLRSESTSCSRSTPINSSTHRLLSPYTLVVSISPRAARITADALEQYGIWRCLDDWIVPRSSRPRSLSHTSASRGGRCV